MEEVEVSEAYGLQLLSESMQHQLHTLWGNKNEEKNVTIFRTPHNISQSKKKLFEPSVISIGPFHRGQKHLQALEEQKWRFLQDFLSRGNHISLDLCLTEMKLLEDRTRRCYSEKVNLNSHSFIEMMLLDGCFVLEFFLKLYEENLNSIVEVGWNSFNFIQHDLLLLENQIPFFIVEKLYEIGLEQKDKMDFVKYLARIFFTRGLTMNFLEPIIADHPPAEIHHLVHLCYHYLVPNPEKSFDLTRMSRADRLKGLLTRRFLISQMVIPSATELKHKGLNFRPKSNPEHMLDISFENGVLKIPRLAITNDNKPILANLVAFEHSKYGKYDSPFTRFVEFWDNLVKTPNDVKILQQCGIVENWLGSEEEVVHFINQFTEVNIFERDPSMAELYMNVNRYIELWYKSSWNRERAKLIRYKEISLSAFVGLVLTFVQSLYAVYAYYVPPNS